MEDYSKMTNKELLIKTMGEVFKLQSMVDTMGCSLGLFIKEQKDWNYKIEARIEKLESWKNSFKENKIQQII